MTSEESMQVIANKLEYSSDGSQRTLTEVFSNKG